MRKKVLGVLLIVVMISSMLFGCNTSEPFQETAATDEAVTNETDTKEETAAETDSSEETMTDSNNDQIKIGVSIWSVSDSLGGSVKRMLDSAAEALGCEIEYVETSFETEQVVASIENLCASGCNAIIVCNSADGQMPKLIKTCEEKGVYLAQFFRTISDEEVAELANNSDYYVGRTCEDEYQVGADMAQIMADKGCKNVAIVSYTHGDLTAETRYSGYMDTFNELGINVVAEQWELLAAEDAASAVNNFIASYPEIDGIAVVGGGGEPLSGTISAIENNGKTGDIVVVSTDFTDTLENDLAEGKVSAMSGGHWMDPFFSFMMCYNAVNDAYDSAEFPFEISHPMLYVASSEDYADFKKYFEEDVLPFTAEEIQNLAITYNEATTIDDLKNAAEKLSIEDVKERHTDLIE